MRSARDNEAIRVVLAFLLVTLVVGTWMRATLAGWTTLAGLDFAQTRHAHSHLGYFAVLFPFAWLSLATLGARVPGPRLKAAYLAGATLAFAGFLRAGYGPEAIAGSTLVGGVWLFHAARNVREMRTLTSWVAGIPLGLLLACACVPPIALFTRRDPAFAASWVQSFLALLLFGSLFPAALAKVKARPVPWPLFVFASVVTALNLGVLSQSVWTRVGPITYAAILLYSVGAGYFRASDTKVRAIVALMFLAVAVSTFIVGVRLVDNARDLAIAGVHFAILGPFLTVFLPRLSKTWALLSAAMAIALVLPRFGGGELSQPVATIVGVGLVVVAAINLAATFASSDTPGDKAQRTNVPDNDSERAVSI